MNKIILLDTNIVYNMIANQSCMNEILDVLKYDKILISDISIYELTNKSVCLKDIVSNRNIDICRINCWGKGLSNENIRLVKDQIITKRYIDSAIYYTMSKNYKYMIQPIMSILLYKYISLIGPLFDKNSQIKFANFLVSKRFIKEVKGYSLNILNTINPKEVKNKISYYVKKVWKKCIYVCRFEHENKLIKFKEALKGQKLGDFFGINIYGKKGSEMYEIISKNYDDYIFPIIEKKYNARFSEYIKFLFLKSLVEKFNIDINSLFDTLLISSLSCDVVLCTDDDKMNQYMHLTGTYDEISDKIRLIKHKYD